MFPSNAKELGVRLAKPWQKNAFFFHSPGGYPFLMYVIFVCHFSLGFMNVRVDARHAIGLFVPSTTRWVTEAEDEVEVNNGFAHANGHRAQRRSMRMRLPIRATLIFMN